MTAVRPAPLLRFAGQRPPLGVQPATPWQLAVAIRDYALAAGFAIDKLERSRVTHSGSLYLSMTAPGGQCWKMRVSNHRSRPRTGHATPHVDLVSLDGIAGIGVGRKVIDAIVAGTVPWFDPEPTIRPRAQVRRNCRKRRK